MKIVFILANGNKKKKLVDFYLRIGKMRTGKGIITWFDGSKYEGYFKNNLLHGRGRLIHSNGEIYEGWWYEDKTNGFGRYTSIDG